MGCSSSQQIQVYDHEGRVVMNRKCIVFVSPPSFQTSKFIQSKPDTLNYRFISVGKLIRDEINKRTHYSKIIMQNLAKHKKINDKILEVLLKNVALQGNFIIQFCPKDSQDLQIWNKFLHQVEVEMVVIINPNHEADISQHKALYEQKMKQYTKDIKNVKDLAKTDLIVRMDPNQDMWDNIVKHLHTKEKKKQKKQRK